jgi:hypothetical protein
MNRVVGFALIGGFLASSAAASGAEAAKQVPKEGNAYLAAPAVQQVATSVQEALPAAPASPGPANTSQRIIHASQAPTRTALPPALAELPPLSKASPSPCPPAHSDLACHKP